MFLNLVGLCRVFVFLCLVNDIVEIKLLWGGFLVVGNVVCKEFLIRVFILYYFFIFFVL